MNVLRTLVSDLKCSNLWILASIIHNLNCHIRHSPITHKKNLRKKNYLAHKFSTLFPKLNLYHFYSPINHIYNFNYTLFGHLNLFYINLWKKNIHILLHKSLKKNIHILLHKSLKKIFIYFYINLWKKYWYTFT